MSLRPLFARILLRREKQKMIGNIHLPPNAQKRHASLKCEVLEVGPDAHPCIEVGMTVLVGKFAGDWLDESGNPVPDDEGVLFICTDEDILCQVME